MLFIGCVLGACIGAFLIYLAYRYKKGGFEHLAQEIIQRAELQVEKRGFEIQLELKQKEFEHSVTLEKRTDEKMQKILAKEEKFDQQLTLFEKKSRELEKKEKELTKLQLQLAQQSSELIDQKKHHLENIQAIAQMTVDEAKNCLFEMYESEIKAECSNTLLKRQKEIESAADQYAAMIITTAIHRLSLPTVNEVAVVTVALPSHDLKSRVIGREGRNIRALEQATGVNFLIDETPNAIVISSYDPIRKEIARIALKELMQDGRIHPTRIEEVVEKAQASIQKLIKEHGDTAAEHTGLVGLHPELILYLGKLSFRYSFGQNVLAHSIEVSHLMGIMASELHLDIKKAKRIGLLHDIGKACSHEYEGSHALIGQQLALKYGENEDVANGIGCHHEEIPPTSIESVLCIAADKISGARPGARSESIEHYFKRSAKLEQIARQFEGVEKAYAIHAGREVRVIVEPEHFDDATTMHLARLIAQKIEKELSYPGKIKVTVIREKRAIEYAS